MVERDSNQLEVVRSRASGHLLASAAYARASPRKLAWVSGVSAS